MKRLLKKIRAFFIVLRYRMEVKRKSRKITDKTDNIKRKILNSLSDFKTVKMPGKNQHIYALIPNTKYVYKVDIVRKKNGRDVYYYDQGHKTTVALNIETARRKLIL